MATIHRGRSLTWFEFNQSNGRPRQQGRLYFLSAVFAPNHRWREQVTLARRGRRKTEAANETAPAPHVSMTWAQRLKRVFKIDIETCEHCGGAVKVIASIEDPIVIKKILEHFDRRAEPATSGFTPVARAPPQMVLPGLKEPG